MIIATNTGDDTVARAPHQPQQLRRHVAIIRRPYAELILAGTKTVEARLTKRPIPPWGALAVGEPVHIKVSSGPYVGVARVAKFEQVEIDSDAAMAAVRQRFTKPVCAPAEFWDERAAARYATFVALELVEPTEVGPSLSHLNAGQRRSAWHVLAPHEASLPSPGASHARVQSR